MNSNQIQFYYFRKIHNYILNFVHLEPERQKTGENIAEVLDECLAKFGLNTNRYVVTDEGSNMNWTAYHLTCCCHQLNTVAKRTTELYENIPYDAEIKKRCKYVRMVLGRLQEFISKLRGNSQICAALGTILRTYLEVRWSSKFDMVDKFMDHRSEIEIAIRQYEPTLLREYQTLMKEGAQIYEAYCYVIGPIAKAITKLEGENYVTSSHILRLFAFLYRRYTTPSDNEFITLLSSTALIGLNLKIANLDKTVILVAAYLDPSVHKKLDDICACFGRYSVDEVHQCVVDAAKNLADFVAYVPPTQSCDDEDDGFKSKTIDKTAIIEMEMKAYEVLILSSESVDPIEFWQKNGKQLRLLTALAKKFLAIPASSAPSERAFSRLKIVDTALRNRLSPDKVAALIGFRSLINSGLCTDTEQVKEPPAKRVRSSTSQGPSTQ